MRHRTRTLPPEPNTGVIPGTDFIKPVEHIDAAEDAEFERIIRFLVRKMKKTYRAGSGSDVPEVFEDGHGLTTALVRGTLTISQDDLAQLPDQLRVGLLEVAAEYPVVARFNVIDTTQGIVMGPRLSLKIQVGDRDVDIVVAAFVPAPLPNFFIRDATDMTFVAGMPGSLLSPSGVSTAARLLGRNIRGFNGYAKRNITTGPFGIRYGTLLPYRLGDAASKWLLDPEQDQTISAPPDKHYAKHQAKAVEQWFTNGGRDISFRLSTQVATVQGTPGPVRAVEDGELRWDEDLNPVFAVGRFHFPAIELGEMIADFGSPSEWPNLLRFNIGDTLDEHMPLGQNNRLRIRLYEAHSNARRAHLHGREAPTMASPFG